MENENLLGLKLSDEALLTRDEIELLEKNFIKFDEDYKNGVEQTWGGRSAIVYNILYRLINEANGNKK